MNTNVYIVFIQKQDKPYNYTYIKINLKDT